MKVIDCEHLHSSSVLVECVNSLKPSCDSFCTTVCRDFKWKLITIIKNRILTWEIHCDIQSLTYYRKTNLFFQANNCKSVLLALIKMQTIVTYFAVIVITEFINDKHRLFGVYIRSSCSIKNVTPKVPTV